MDRQETTRRFQLLQSQIAKGKFHVAQHLRNDFERSFARVAFAADGLIDEATLDGQVRSTLRELVAVRPDNFHRTGDKVFDNLHSAFREHEVKLNELRAKKWKFAGLDVGSFFVVGGIEMAAALTGLPVYGAAAATASRLGVVPTAKDLNAKLEQIRGDSKALTSTGVGILFKHRKNV